MQQAEMRQLIATHGVENVRAIVENFNWDADSYTKLQSAYKEAEKKFGCRLIDPEVCTAQYNTLYTRNIINYCSGSLWAGRNVV